MILHKVGFLIRKVVVFISRGVNRPSTQYRLSRYKEFRSRINRFNRAKKKAFKKYGRVCDKCQDEDHLEVHHLNDKSHFPRQRYTIKNLRVLCRDCHTEFHTEFKSGFREKCTREDYFEWLL